jgi:two-component system LytT family response regulator
MIKAVIIDDEPLLVQSISSMLQKHCPKIGLIGTASSAISGKKMIEGLQPQLVFLDIQMPYGNGFDLLNSFEKINFQVIIISAFDDYAVKAFKYEALDYILKPIDIDELITSVNKAIERIKQLEFLQTAESKMQDANTFSVVDQKLRLQTSKNTIFVGFDDILYFQSNGNYTYIHLTNDEEHFVVKQLGEFEKQLPINLFCRVHNEFIVNTSKVINYIKGRGGYAVLNNGMKIKISANKRSEFLKRYIPGITIRKEY